MKKTNVIAISSLFTMSALAGDFLVIINKDHNNYEAFTEIEEVVDWAIVGTECISDKETSDVYNGKTYNQTTICSEISEKYTTSTRTFSDGRTEVNINKETRSNDISSENQIITGNHYENSCKNILSFDSSLNTDGLYNIKLSNDSILNVYCDMTTQGGGYTAYWTKDYHLSISDFYSLVESNWVQDSYQFYWHINNEDGSNLAQVLTNFNNSYSHWLVNHTGGDGGGTIEDPNLDALWKIKIPSLNVDIERAGIVRAIPYLDAYIPYNETSYGIHYKRTIRGEHYPWFNLDGTIRSEGYLCADETICDYNYGTLTNKEHTLLFR